jgi:hypothetical protein
MPLSIPQQAVAKSTARMRVLVAGRRFGKSHLSVNQMARFAAIPKQKVFYVAPTYRMARSIIWESLKEKLRAVRWLDKSNETDMTVHLRNGSTISLRGADKPDSLRGVELNFLVMDEAADIDADAWHKVLRPTLSDTGGHALFVGTPKSRNWFYDLWLKGQNGEDGWASWQFTTMDGGNVPPEEIETARKDLDELTFAAEYLASFVSFEGRAYYPFERSTHCAPLKYDPRAPLILAYDFNCEPGVCAIIQEQHLPNGLDGTGIIAEVYIPRNSNTPAVCRKLVQDWGNHQGVVKIYADATGGARGSARVLGSDLDLIKAELAPVFQDRLQMRVPPANPAERSRINAVNSRLKSAAGEVRLMVDPIRAPHVVRDFEGVALLAGGSGELDKKSNPALSHISDALGYYVSKEFPIANNRVRIGSAHYGP